MRDTEKKYEMLNNWKNPGASRLEPGFLLSLARDPREASRLQAARLAGRIVRSRTGTIESVLALLVKDSSPAVRRAARESLLRLLLRSSGLVRSRIALEWAASWNSFVRRAIAEALGDPRIRFIGETAVVEHLAHDSLPSIREAAARAAGAQEPT